MNPISDQCSLRGDSQAIMQISRMKVTNKDADKMETKQNKMMRREKKEEITGEDECGGGAEEAEERSCFIAAEGRHVEAFCV